MNWQPIETAPKDGTAILAFCPFDKIECRLAVLRWCYVWSGYGTPTQKRHDVGWELAVDHDSRDEAYFRPTHWMPIPAAPAVWSATMTANLRDGSLNISST